MSNQIPEFDLGKVMATAAQVAVQSKEKKSNYSGPRLIYPQIGELKVRLIYNQPSGLVLRKYERHKINGKNHVCLQVYGHECPMCKVLENIKNVNGVDMWKEKRTTRGISYAEYVSSNYKWDKPEEAPKPGDIVILMYPWNVYNSLNRLINSAGEHIHALIASNVGGMFKITRWMEGSQHKYDTVIDPFEHNHRTCEKDEDYIKLITELDNLSEKFAPSVISESLIAEARSVAEELTRTYLTGHIMGKTTSGTNLGAMVGAPMLNPNYHRDPISGQEYDLINGAWVPRPPAPPVAPPPPPPITYPPYGNTVVNSPAPEVATKPPITPPIDKPANVPECYGTHAAKYTTNPNECLVCPHEGQCNEVK